MGINRKNNPLGCRCGGRSKVFGPSEFAPTSNWGVYCSNNFCDKMASGASLEGAVDQWNDVQISMSIL